MRLAATQFSHYLNAMKRLRLILPLLLLVALTGAPFGMGRMMDMPGSHGAAHASAMHGMHHDSEPAHKGSAPHYMVCAACAAAPYSVNASFEFVVLPAELAVPEPSALSGTHLLPPVPPPKPVLLTA